MRYAIPKKREVRFHQWDGKEDTISFARSIGASPSSCYLKEAHPGCFFIAFAIPNSIANTWINKGQYYVEDSAINNGEGFVMYEDDFKKRYKEVKK